MNDQKFQAIKLQKQAMKAVSMGKEVLYKLDFFNTRQLLRYKDEPQYRTLTGGFISLAIIITILATFTNLIITTLNRIQITSTSLSTRDYDPPQTIVTTDPDSMFMFGVEIWHHDLNTGDRYFDVILLNKWLHTGEDTNQTVQIPLEPCTKNHWASYPKVLADYDRLHMNYWLCPPMNTSFEIKGKFASELSKTLEVSVRKCKNQTDPTRLCANQSTIDAYMTNQGQIFYTIYYMNPLVNPSEQDYLQVYLEDNNYIIFNQNFGSEGVLFLSDFTITTDLSIWPFSDNLVETGSLVENFAIKNPYSITADMDVYCFFSFYKAAKTNVYSRSFSKLADVVSYIGGLFGAVTAALMIFTVYNGHSFQISLGGYLFKPDPKDGNLFKKFNFLKFLVYLVYGIFKALKLCTCWTTMNKYVECRKVMLKELDILYLLERVQFLERSITTLFSDHQFKGLHLQNKFTMDQAKKIRHHYDLRKNIISKMSQIKDRRKKQNQSSLNASLELNSQENTFGNTKDDIKVYPEQNIGEISHSNKNYGDMSSQNSSDAQILEQFDLVNDLEKLKEEAAQGCLMSQRIWEKIDEDIIRNLSRFSKDKDLATPFQTQEKEKQEIQYTQIIKNTFDNSQKCIFTQNEPQNVPMELIKKNPKQILNIKESTKQYENLKEQHVQVKNFNQSNTSEMKDLKTNTNQFKNIREDQKKVKNNLSKSMNGFYKEKQKKKKSRQAKRIEEDEWNEQEF